MTERKNLPAKTPAQDVVVATAQRSSLVARGLVAFQESKKRELVRNSQGIDEKNTLTPEDRYRMIETVAYFIAEQNGFVDNFSEYWKAAEAQIDAKLSGN